MLEAEGIVEVKFKQRDIQKTMQRLDPELLRQGARISGNYDYTIFNGSAINIDKPTARTTGIVP